MKSLSLLGCAIVMVACGSSSGKRVDGMQTPPLPLGAPQVPQQPTNSVAPMNNQAAPINSQQPPLNSQQPPLSSTGAGVTCSQVATAGAAAGCVVSAKTLATCNAYTLPGVACGSEFSALLSCAIADVVCDADGDFDVGAACEEELNAFEKCVEGPTQTCTSPSCTGCADACATCTCHQQTDDSRDCTNQCAAVN